MRARRPSPRRPSLAAPRGQLRAAYRLSAGLSPAAVARAEAVAEGEIEALLAQPDFQALLTALRELQDLPEPERLRPLERHAWCVLELALADGDWRAAAFIAHQIRLGNNPARTLAQAVLTAQTRAAAPPPTVETAAPEPDSNESAPSPRPARPYDAVGAAMRRAATSLRASVAAEQLVATEPVAAEPIVAPAPATAARPRRGDGLAARLRGSTAAQRGDPSDAAPRRLLRSWARAP